MTELRTLLTGLHFGESPRWHSPTGRLLVADWAAGEVLSVDPDSGKREVAARVDSFPLCVDALPDGRLLLVDAHRSLLLRQEPDGALATHADLSGVYDRGWNDIVVDGRGNAYVNSPGFDMMAGAPPAPGLIALARPDGTVRRVADDVHFPNGMAVTPDGSTLIVAESYAHRLSAFTLAADGTLTGRRVWAALGEDEHPDGICLDAEGAVWYGDVGARHAVRVREGGEVLRTVDTGTGCFACCLGGADRRTLFLVATEWRGPEHVFDGPPTGRVLALRVDVPGAGRP